MSKSVENNIAFVGDLTVDKYTELGKIHLGGASLNSAVWALRAGASRVSALAAVGTDEYGEQFKKQMAVEGVSAEGLSVLSGATSAIEIIVEPGGERRWGPWEAGVLAQYHLGEPEYALLRTQDAASLTIYGPTQHLLPEFANGWRHEKRKPFLAVNFDDLSQLGHSVDIVAKHIRGINVGFFGLDLKKDETLIKGLHKLSQHTNKLIVVTLGSYGAFAWKGTNEYFSPALRIDKKDIKDTTGAGDAFLASFLVEYIRTGGDIEASLAMGNRFGAQKIQILGAY